MAVGNDGGSYLVASIYFLAFGLLLALGKALRSNTSLAPMLGITFVVSVGGASWGELAVNRTNIFSTSHAMIIYGCFLTGLPIRIMLPMELLLPIIRSLPLLYLKRVNDMTWVIVIGYLNVGIGFLAYLHLYFIATEVIRILKKPTVALEDCPNLDRLEMDCLVDFPTSIVDLGPEHHAIFIKRAAQFVGAREPLLRLLDANDDDKIDGKDRQVLLAALNRLHLRYQDFHQLLPEDDDLLGDDEQSSKTPKSGPSERRSRKSTEALQEDAEKLRTRSRRGTVRAVRPRVQTRRGTALETHQDQLLSKKRSLLARREAPLYLDALSKPVTTESSNAMVQHWKMHGVRLGIFTRYEAIAEKKSSTHIGVRPHV
eukprot:Polyplicarium_translucidae@DN3847_c0_g1_i1.p1